MNRPSTLAVLAAYQALRANESPPKLEINDNEYELVRAALLAADRVDPPITAEFAERIRIMRAVAVYRGAVALQTAYIARGAIAQPMQVVMEAMGILTAAESHLGAAPYPTGGGDASQQSFL